MKSVIVIDPPVEVEDVLGDEAESAVLLPWQIVALVGDIVGTDGAGFTVITTSSVVFPQGALLPIVHRKVYVPAPPAWVNVALFAEVLLNCAADVEGPETTFQTPTPFVGVLAAKVAVPGIVQIV